MTRKQARAYVKVNAPSIIFEYNPEYKEYRLAYRHLEGIARENCAYYTDSMQDAIETALFMHEESQKG